MGLFSTVLFNFAKFGNFLFIYAIDIDFYLIILCSENIFCVISIFWNLLRAALCLAFGDFLKYFMHTSTRKIFFSWVSYQSHYLKFPDNFCLFVPSVISIQVLKY